MVTLSILCLRRRKVFNFCKIVETKKKPGVIFIEPNFTIGLKKSDLMIRGKDFYAVWDADSNMWVTNENYIVDVIDQAIDEKISKKNHDNGFEYIPRYMRNADSGSIDKWHKYVQKQLRDDYHELDTKIIFANTETTRKDFATKRLPYNIEEGSIEAYDELMSTLYDQSERDKLEWAMGAIISGDSKNIQKFIVLYGSAGSGKSTFLNILQGMFEGYTSIFNAKELASSNNSFALESFKNNPLISIQHDGDLSRIEDNTLLNSIVSHEQMEVNEKFKSKYIARFNTFLFMGTNKPVKITEAKSGLLRRLIDVKPSGRTLSYSKYNRLMKQISFEYGAIADYVLKKYLSMGPDYYSTYVPIDMISATNDFYDFMDYYYEEFANTEYVQLKTAWELYKTYCDMAKVGYTLSYRQMKNEFGNYFEEFLTDYYVDRRTHVRNVYVGFRKEKFTNNFEKIEKKSDEKSWLNFNSKVSSFDIVCSDCPAQLANKESGTPTHKWSQVMTKLQDIDTTNLHYVKVPQNHIVIDFDIKGDDGKKSAEKNFEAASKFPPTYAELSKSGCGIHLHYIYDGDVSKLSAVYDDNIEVKVFKGNSSLRRMLTLCNDIPIAKINSGLPFKEDKKVVDFKVIKSEKAIRTMIKKNLNKEYHANTRPSIDFIYTILEQAYANKELVYDVSDLKQSVLYFASNSSNQSEYCVELVTKMKFKSESEPADKDFDETPIVFYDVEVFPNLFLVNWKFAGEENKCVRMINPTPSQITELLQYRLIGYNCRRYDNHIMYARTLGYSNLELYHLSQKLVKSVKSVSNNVMFANAYNLSYLDVYDMVITKQTLKKWEIDLGIHHQELGYDWDKPVPEDKWEEVALYCDNDVIATEAVFNSEEGQSCYLARQIISEISGLTVNSTNNAHSAAIVFNGNKKPQSEFVYTDLSEIFPGYVFDNGKSYYNGEEVGEGGYVYANPGIYSNVWTFDIASMHPHSIKALNLFGDKYTKNFYDMVEARIHIKHGDFDKVYDMFDGKLKKYLKDKSQAKALSNALKIVINSVYGLTASKYDTPFKDVRNIDNIVAKRGALFMITLRDKLQAMGVTVIHIKTDSIKIPDPTEEIKNFIYEYGKQFGYSFEVEDIYKKFCLVNNAVYIAQHEDGSWTATGAQFAQPYVFKTLFSKEKIEFKDLCETKSVQTAIYLDFDEGIEPEHDYRFIGRVGLFCPIKPGNGGGVLVAERTDTKTGEKKYSSVTGTKGYRWLESEFVKENNMEDAIDKSYYISLVDAAKDTISKFGDFEMFVKEN